MKKEKKTVLFFLFSSKRTISFVIQIIYAIFLKQQHKMENSDPDFQLLNVGLES